MEDQLIVILGGLVLLYLYSRRTDEDDTQQTGAGTTTESESPRGGRGTGSAIQAADAETTSQAGSITDPTDTAVYLEERGWTQVSATPERYVGHYQADDASMRGGLERTPGGRRKFYVHDPPLAFIKAADYGKCLVAHEDLAEDAFEVHFIPKPASFGHGIDIVEDLLEAGHA